MDAVKAWLRLLFAWRSLKRIGVRFFALLGAVFAIWGPLALFFPHGLNTSLRTLAALITGSLVTAVVQLRPRSAIARCIPRTNTWIKVEVSD
ncbi:MAG: hypothetical protein ACRDQZ_16140, partial [Mycobacteriales bacterium]